VLQFFLLPCRAVGVLYNMQDSKKFSKKKRSNCLVKVKYQSLKKHLKKPEFVALSSGLFLAMTSHQPSSLSRGMFGRRGRESADNNPFFVCFPFPYVFRKFRGVMKKYDKNSSLRLFALNPPAALSISFLLTFKLCCAKSFC
jgi:hypothetical protein